MAQKSATMKLLDTKKGEAASSDDTPILEGEPSAAEINKMGAKALNAWYKAHEEAIEITDWLELLVDDKRKNVIEALEALASAVKEAEAEDAKKAKKAEKAKAKIDAKKAADEGPSQDEVKAALEKAVSDKKAKDAKAAKEKPKVKGTAVAKKTAKEGEVIPPDFISKTATEIENVKTQEDAEAAISQLLEAEGVNVFKLGGYLSVVQQHQWFGDHENFREYVQNTFGMSYRKAKYLTDIYTGLLESGISWEKVAKIGWTKMAAMISILTVENVDEWVKKAESMKTLQLIAEVDAKKKAAISPDGKATEVATVTTKTFKLHADQRETIMLALEKAREQSGTEVDAVALEHICLDFMAGPTKTGESKTITSKKFYEDRLAAHSGDIGKTLEDVFAGFEEVFPNVNVEVG